MADDTQPPSNHNVYAAWLFGSILLLFYLGVFIFAPDQLPEFKHRMLGIISALLCGLFAFFLVGTLQLTLKLKSKGQKLAVQGSGGLAAFGLILIWWNYSSFAPIKSIPNQPSIQINGSNNTVNQANLIAEFSIRLNFSDNTQGVWNAETLLKERKGTLLEPLRDAAYFQTFFIDAGALCWPNGLEFSPERLYEQCILMQKIA